MAVGLVNHGSRIKASTKMLEDRGPDRGAVRADGLRAAGNRGWLDGSAHHDVINDDATVIEHRDSLHGATRDCCTLDPRRGASTHLDPLVASFASLIGGPSSSRGGRRVGARSASANGTQMNRSHSCGEMNPTTI